MTYTAVNPEPVACAPCEAGDHENCTAYTAREYGCSCLSGLEHRQWVRARWPDKPVLSIADLAPEDGPSADPEYDGGLGSGDWLKPYIEHEEESSGLSQADLPLTPADRARMGIPKEE